MILSVSNIAWAPEERLDAYDLLANAGVQGLEIAPGLFFQTATDPFAPDVDTVRAELDEITARGLSLVSMQSLLFGVKGASLFSDVDARSIFISSIERSIDLAGRLCIPNLVFGSPGQRRIPYDVASSDAWALATETFRRLGDRAATAGTVIAIEANPVAYGTNFLTTLDEAEAFVTMVDHPAVTIILDLGATHLSGDFGTLPDRVGLLAPQLTHVHVSEPYLAPAPDDATNIVPVLAALRSAGYNRALSIEMKRPKGGLTVLQERIVALKRATAAAGPA